MVVFADIWVGRGFRTFNRQAATIWEERERHDFSQLWSFILYTVLCSFFFNHSNLVNKIILFLYFKSSISLQKVQWLCVSIIIDLVMYTVFFSFGGLGGLCHYQLDRPLLASKVSHPVAMETVIVHFRVCLWLEPLSFHCENVKMQIKGYSLKSLEIPYLFSFFKNIITVLIITCYFLYGSDYTLGEITLFLLLYPYCAVHSVLWGAVRHSIQPYLSHTWPKHTHARIFLYSHARLKGAHQPF